MSSKDNIIENLTKTIETMSNELALLREQVAYLSQKLYGKSSRRSIHYPLGQLILFEEELPEEDSDLPC